jgi:hypothetical protein
VAAGAAGGGGGGGGGEPGGDAPPTWLTTLDSADGPVTTVQPPGQIGDVGLSWPHRLHQYGGDQAAWAAR